MSKKTKTNNRTIKYGAKTGTKKKPHFGNYDIYSNPKPKDTVRIKYATIKDIKFTINKLESLYARKLRPHARISKIANVLEQRMRVLKEKNPGNRISEKYHIGKTITSRRFPLGARQFVYNRAPACVNVCTHVHTLRGNDPNGCF